MAHFARIENGTVTNVVVVDNRHESNGQEFLNGIGLEGTWIQTSYNENFRAQFAGLGDTYNLTKDRFEPTCYYESWAWNEDLYDYEAPTPMPDDGKVYDWDEATLSWVEVE